MRRLSAIMFTDMVGYTALMQENEARARAARTRQREVLEHAVGNWNGNILQFYGDGTLTVFDSAIEAVQCAVDVQNQLSSEPRVPMRVGIHTGDIVHDEEGVFGDGVNLASRVQSLSVPGAVLVSEKVYDEIKNQPEIGTRSLGQFELKNVKRPLEVYAVTNPTLVVPRPHQLASSGAAARQSVAVLPFVNMSSDPENEFFSDGITEELINLLTRINGLQVTARTSSFAFKGKNKDIRKIGEDLSVGTVLEGSVRKVGDRVRVTAQLIDTRNGYHLFSETYDRCIDDVFEIQDEISTSIVGELEPHFSPRSEVSTEMPVIDSVSEASEDRSQDTAAYTEYLKGLHLWHRWTPEDNVEAIKHFHASIRLDPDSALPYTGMALAYTRLGAMGYLPPKQVFPKAEQAALKAMELQSGLGMSHVALATVKMFYDWGFQEAYDCLQKALGMNPGSAEVHHVYALYLRIIGELDESVEQVEEAVELDPLSPRLKDALGLSYQTAGRLEDARDQFQVILQLDPGFRAAREHLGLTLALMGDYDRAVRILEEQTRLTGDPLKVLAPRGWVYATMGDEDKALEMIAGLEERRIRDPHLSLWGDFGFVYSALGDLEKTLEYFNKAIDERLGMVVFLKTSRYFDHLQSEPGFQALLERIGLG